MFSYSHEAVSLHNIQNAVILIPKERVGIRLVGLTFLGQFLAEFAACHAIGSQQDEGDAQYLAHVDGHGGFPCFLHLFGVFDEETGREDGGQAETEIEARTDFLRIFMVKHVSGNEKYEIANGFIELAGMAWQHVDALEDESPRHVGRFADDFRVHQVAQTDEHGTGWSGDGNVVQYTHDIQFRFPDVKPKGKHQAYRTAVAGQSGVTGERPTVGRLPHGQDHFQGVGEEVARFVEQAVPQTGAYEDAHETIEEQRVEQFVGDVLLPIQALHQYVGCQQGEAPT